jgi:hypothetical protein
VLMYFTGESVVPKELNRMMRISDDVIRHIIVRVEPQYVDMTRIEQPQPVAEQPEELEEEIEQPVEASEETPTEEPMGEPEETVEEEVPAEKPVAEESTEESNED